MQPGGRADGFAFFTRPALEAYSSVWSEFLGNTCLGLPQNLTERGALCRTNDVAVMFGTECLIALHLHRQSTVLQMDERMAAWLIVRAQGVGRPAAQWGQAISSYSYPITTLPGRIL